MALSTPFGNGPSDVQSPVPQGTMAQALPPPQQPAQQATPNPAPTTPPPAAAPAVPARAPAQDQNPQGGMSSEEQSLLQQAQGMTPEEQNLLSKVPSSDTSLVGGIFGQGEIKRDSSGNMKVKIGSDWHDLSEKTWQNLQTIGNVASESIKLGGMVGGGMIGAAAGGGPASPVTAAAGGVIGGGLGYDGADGLIQLAKHMVGIKDDQGLNHLANFMTGAMGETGGIVGGKVASSLASPYANIMASRASQSAAQSAGAPAAQEAAAVGTQLLTHEAAPDTVGGQQSAAQVGQIMNGQQGPGLQSSFENFFQQRKQDLLNAFQSVKDQFGPQVKASFDNGVPFHEAFKPGEAIDDVVTGMRKKIGFYKKDILDSIGDDRIDPTPILSQFDNELQNLGIMKDGKPHSVDLSDAPPREMLRQRMILKGLMEDSTSPKGDVSPLSDSIEFGKQSGAPGPEDSVKSDSPPGTQTIAIRDLDRMIDTTQDYWRYLSNTGDPRASRFGRLQKGMNDMYYGGLANAAEQAPEDLGESVSMLRRYNSQYSKNIDNLLDLSDKVSQNPNMAITEILKPGQPEQIHQLFNALPQSSADKMRGLFLQHVQDQATSDLPGRNMDNVGAALKQLNKYTPESLSTIFGGDQQSENVMSILKTMQRTQNIKFNAAAPQDSIAVKGLVGKIGQLASGVGNALVDLLSQGKNKEVSDYIASPEFADQVSRYRIGYERANQVKGALGKVGAVGGTLGGDYEGNKMFQNSSKKSSQTYTRGMQ